MNQIRITRTNDLNHVLSFLKERYPLLSEAEIVKMALSKQYYQETRQEIPNTQTIADLQKSEEDVQAGRVISFASGKAALKYLTDEINHEKRTTR